MEGGLTRANPQQRQRVMAWSWRDKRKKKITKKKIRQQKHSDDDDNEDEDVRNEKKQSLLCARKDEAMILKQETKGSESVTV